MRAFGTFTMFAALTIAGIVFGYSFMAFASTRSLSWIGYVIGSFCVCSALVVALNDRINHPAPRRRYH